MEPATVTSELCPPQVRFHCQTSSLEGVIVTSCCCCCCFGSLWLFICPTCYLCSCLVITLIYLTCVLVYLSPFGLSVLCQVAIFYWTTLYRLCVLFWCFCFCALLCTRFWVRLLWEISTFLMTFAFSLFCVLRPLRFWNYLVDHIKVFT